MKPNVTRYYDSELPSIIVTVFLCSFLLTAGCARLPFGTKPNVMTVDPSSLVNEDVQKWYSVKKYKNGYWYHAGDGGTYVLVSLGSRQREFTIESKDIRKDSKGNVNLELAINPKQDSPDDTNSPVYPHKLFKVQPPVDDYDLVIREHQRGTIKLLKEQNKSLAEKNKQLKDTIEDLRGAMQFMQSQLSDSQTTIRRQKSQISSLRKRRASLEESRIQLQRENKSLRKEINSLQTKISNLNDQLKSTVEKNKELKQELEKQLEPNKSNADRPQLSIYYDIGKYELTSEQKTKLLDTFQNMSELPTVSLSVIGFSDTNPVRGQRIKSNLYLSTMRAWHVAKFLVNNTELNENKLLLIGAGQPEEYPKHAESKTYRRVDLHKLDEKPVQIR